MLVITGTGRSGTGYMSKLLTAVGVECGHEQVYTPHGVAKKDVPAESSWCAVPHLQSPSVVIIRHPLKVVKSWLELGIFLTRSEWGEFVKRYSPMVYTYKRPEDRALARWLYWNMYATSKADLVIRLEDMNLENLNRILKLGGFNAVDKLPELGRINKKTNYKKHTWDGDWTDFDPNLARAAQEFARQWGY